MNRDLWDIVWLVQQGVLLPPHLIPMKVRDHQRTNAEFIEILGSRLKALKTESRMRSEFVGEMRRFLPAAMVRGTLESPANWEYLNQTLQDQVAVAIKALK